MNKQQQRVAEAVAGLDLPLSRKRTIAVELAAAFDLEDDKRDEFVRASATPVAVAAAAGFQRPRPSTDKDEGFLVVSTPTAAEGEFVATESKAGTVKIKS